MTRKSESGAQLLARLQNRPDLTAIDPFVFGSSVTGQGYQSSSASQGNIIELFGGEGTGKTELALHYVARTCLPSQWNGFNLPGLGAKALIIDTEFKFNVLRLAVILERLVVTALEESDHKYNQDVSKNEVSEASEPNQVVSDTEKEKSDKNELHQKSAENPCGKSFSDSENNTVTNKQGSCFPSMQSNLRNEQSETKPVAVVNSEETNRHQTLPSAEELDEIVQSSLSRVQVMKVTTSLQLVTSLMSVENSVLSCEPKLTLVVVDSISSFYWPDRAGEPENLSCIESKMKHLAKLFSTCSCEMGVTFLVTKFTVMGEHRRRPGEGTDDWSGAKGSKSRDSLGRCLDEMEFLGRSWAAMGAKRIWLEKKVCHYGDTCEFSADCELWPSERKFVIMDDVLRFL